MTVPESLSARLTFPFLLATFYSLFNLLQTL